MDLGEAQSVTPYCISFTEGVAAGLVQTCVFTNWGGSLLGSSIHTLLFKISLLIYLWLCWVFVAARAFLWLQREGTAL